MGHRSVELQGIHDDISLHKSIHDDISLHKSIHDDISLLVCGAHTPKDLEQARK